MRYAYLACVFLHVLAALIWIGGAAFIAFVLGPILRRRPAGEAPGLLFAIARRFRSLGWGCLAVLVATGAGNLAFRGVGMSDLLSGAVFRGSAGHAFACKMILVAIMLAISALHDFRWGPRAARAIDADPASAAAAAGRKRAGRVGRFVFLLNLLILLAAIAFVRGGF